MTKKLLVKLISAGMIFVLAIQVIQYLQEITFVSIPSVNEEAEMNNDVEGICYRFVSCINKSDKSVYDYIDTSNSKLYSDVNRKLYSLNLGVEIKEITAENGIYNIDAKVKGKGSDWQSSRIMAYFKIGPIDGEYKIIDTDLFDKIDAKIDFFEKLEVIKMIVAAIAGILIAIFSITILFRKPEKPETDNTNDSIK